MLVQDEQKLIGLVAKESGVPIKTIRYYEELGLLKASGRTEGGFRLFHSDVLARLNFIKRAQSLGLSLSEIKEFLNVHDEGELPCDHIKIKLQEKLVDIDRQIQQLLILKQELEGLLSGWESIPENPEQTICPIIERA
ncbi:heavy metal-responsive transcriptional regulator [Chlorogloeopsis fritschii PCC 9212]|uniref:Cu(I)-responsive transcriptional regulator n=1 Tax=Chlorogloeopsis fritschii PCC 6912 TaxID=211165 RepID=A0A3S0ZYQ5_CHLFR|nr:heavy metal-responsive transcriptional regulator [Chlorogloeopsis fritschii]MBF2004539.1 heavy metal-responsive transcriptional regulator [Chlorogloeopsis fritschii C42_A2020_084]RUR83395.1 Cu(I)-responsive transcriptional regulator [Chlorogloeopsis fritschii PCC 6912]